MPTPDTLGSIGTVEVGPTPPAVGMDGMLWFNPDEDMMYISLDGEWVSLGSGGGGGGDTPDARLPDAPAEDGSVLVSEDGDWVVHDVIDGGTF